MGIWAVIFGLVLVLLVLSCVFLVRYFRKFAFMQRLMRRYPRASWAVSALPLVIAAVFCLVDAVNTILVAIHLMVIWAVCDAVGFLANRARRTKRAQGKPYAAGVVAVALTACYFAYGWVAAHEVQATEYALTSEKPVQLRVLQVSDAHVGALFDGDGFAAYMERAESCNPDVIVITGDLVDDGTTREDMLKTVQALGAMKSTYGSFYVYGNHDRGYGLGRDFTGDDLVAALREAGIVVLEDQVVPVGEGCVLVGRLDRSMTGRASMEQLMASVPAGAYAIVLDHQPNDYAAQEESGVDLVLSGHTHGGQLIPIGQIAELIGMNDATYGLQRRGATDFIVNAGIGDWEIQFKSGTIAEYGVIDINR